MGNTVPFVQGYTVATDMKNTVDLGNVAPRFAWEATAVAGTKQPTRVTTQQATVSAVIGGPTRWATGLWPT